MSIQILDDNESNDTNQQSVSATLLASITDTEKLNSAIQEATNNALVAVGEAVDRSFRYADERALDSVKNAEKLASEILAKLKQEVSGIGKPKIMAVSYNGERRKLTFPASPYLSKLILLGSARKNILLVGPAGCGKTSVALQLAEALDLKFDSLSFTSGASEAWLLGRNLVSGYVTAGFVDLFENGGIFLGDELDSADANTLMILNSALANGHMTNPITGKRLKRHDNFIFMGAANTYGLGADSVYTARNRLDAAFLDRFVCGTVPMDYSSEIEETLCPDKYIRETLQEARLKLREMKAKQFISTRALQDSYDLSLVGIPFNDSIKSITASWPSGLAEQIGLVA